VWCKTVKPPSKGLSAERSRNRKPARHCSLHASSIYASSTHTYLVRCEIGSELPILDVSGQIQEEQQKGHPQCHHSPGHLTIMILSNDPRYSSHLEGDQSQIVHITDLDRRRIGGSTCNWSNRSNLPCDQQLFNSRNRDAYHVSA
jgi:hypothetical protein